MPGRRRAVAALSIEFVATTRSRAETSPSSTPLVVDASNATAPVVGTRSSALRAMSDFEADRVDIRSRNGRGSTGATAPPRTRRARPSASRSSRSRRTVIAETPSSSATGSSRNAPSRVRISSRRARRSSPRRVAMAASVARARPWRSPSSRPKPALRAPRLRSSRDRTSPNGFPRARIVRGNKGVA